MTLHVCPTCSEPAIGWWAKSNASSTLPTRCKRCHGLSHIQDWVGFASALLLEVWIWGNIGLAAYLHSWWPIIAIPFGIFAWVAAVGFLADLVPINEPKLKANRTAALWHVMAIAACAIVAFLIFGP